MDNHDQQRKSPFNIRGQLNKAYVSTSSNGTIFLKEEFTVSLDIPDWAGISSNHDTLPECQYWLEEKARAEKAIIKGEDFAIYMLTPRCWHRSPIQEDNKPRTFMRYWV